MSKIYLLTKECIQKEKYDYEPLRFYLSPKKAQRAFRKECRKEKEGKLRNEWVWQSGGDTNGKKICIKEVKVYADEPPETIYVNRKTTHVDGQKISLEIVSVKNGDNCGKRVMCGDWEKKWLEPACILVSSLLLPSLYISSIVYPMAAIYAISVWGAFMACLIGYVLYLIKSHRIGKKLNYSRAR